MGFATGQEVHRVHSSGGGSALAAPHLAHGNILHRNRHVVEKVGVSKHYLMELSAHSPEQAEGFGRYRITDTLIELLCNAISLLSRDFLGNAVKRVLAVKLLS